MYRIFLFSMWYSLIYNTKPYDTAGYSCQLSSQKIWSDSLYWLLKYADFRPDWLWRPPATSREVMAGATQSNACFTLADPTPRLASDVVGGKSGQNLPTSCRNPIHISRMAHHAYIRVGWYGERMVKESYLLQLPLKDSCIVHVRLPIGRRPPDGLPMVSRWGPDSRFRVRNPFTLAEPTASGHNRDDESANVKQAWIQHMYAKLIFWLKEQSRPCTYM